MSLTHIQTIELGSSQSSITFSSIPQDYDDLVLVMSPRTDNSGSRDNVLVKPNSSSTNMSTVTLLGFDSGSTLSNTQTAIRTFAAAATATSNTFGSSSVYISNYTASQDKSISVDTAAENNSSSSYALGIIAALWSDTTAITSLLLEPRDGTNFVSNSTFSLYGVTAGGDGTVTTA